MKKNEKIDIGINIQESLLPFMKPNSFNDNKIIQANMDKTIELKINHVNIISCVIEPNLYVLKLKICK